MRAVGWRPVAAAMLVVAACATTHAMSPETSANRQACTAANDRSDWDAALSVCTLALHGGDLPNDQTAQVLVVRSQAYAAKRDFWHAWYDLDHAVKLNPDYEDAHVHRGLIYVHDKKYDLAIADFGDAIRLNPSAQNLRYRGTAYVESGQNSRGIDDLDQAIRLKSDFADAYGVRGWAYSRLGNREKALADLNTAIRLAPNRALNFTVLGRLHLESGDIQQAIAELDKSIRLNPTDAEAYANRGLAHHFNQEKTEALADLGKALQLAPDYWPAHLYRAAVEAEADPHTMHEDCEDAVRGARYEGKTAQYDFPGRAFTCEGK